MTPKKALEILKERNLFHPRVYDEDLWDAIYLAIEALEEKLEREKRGQK